MRLLYYRTSVHIIIRFGIVGGFLFRVAVRAIRSELRDGAISVFGRDSREKIDNSRKKKSVLKTFRGNEFAYSSF